MSPTPASRPPGFSRRTLLAASAAGVALLAAGCTSSSTEERDKVTSEQADDLAAQVAAQQSLVAAFAAAAAADAGLGGAVADLAGQASEQLDRLRAAAGGTKSSTSSSPPAPGPNARAWLREQVSATATSHATACLEQTGARAALLGSIAAGLRGQDGRLA